MGGFRSRSESARAQASSGESQPRSQGTSRRGKNTGRNPRNTTDTRATGYQQRRPDERKKKAKKHGSGDAARDVVLTVLQDVTLNDAFANLILPKEIARRRLDTRDAAFATELTYGCLRSTGLLDAIIALAAGRPVSKIDSVVLDALRLGTYQLLYTRVSDHAALNTTVNLVKANGAEQAAGFTNGVLRTVTRTPKEEWISRAAATEAGDALGELALRHAHPRWIAAAFAASLGEDPTGDDLPETTAALAADNSRPTVHLAARPGQISAEELALITGGELGQWSPYAVYLNEGAPGELAPVTDGLASVQDEGSQLIALATAQAPLAPGITDAGRWLDLCAGPGGKTAFLASWAVGDDAHVDAVEVAEHRAQLVANTCRDLPVTVHTGDGRKLSAIANLDLPANGFDRILVDAPCTGLGALRRRPEARWRKTPSDVAPLVALQRELLTSALDAVRAGGVVVYSTCSPHQAETVEVVRLVAKSTGAELLDAPALFPDLRDTGEAPFIQLWPHRHGTDAMFIAVLRKPLASEPQTDTE